VEVTEYIIEMRMKLKPEIGTDEEAKLQIATLLHVIKLCVEETSMSIDDIEIGLLRDNESVDLPVDDLDLLHPELRKDK